MEFDEELSVSGSESDHRPPPDLQHSETVPASVASAGRSHEPSPGSGDPMPESHDEEVQQPLMVDPEMARLENQMDIWCLDLKRNVMVKQTLQFSVTIHFTVTWRVGRNQNFCFWPKTLWFVMFLSLPRRQNLTRLGSGWPRDTVLSCTRNDNSESDEFRPWLAVVSNQLSSPRISLLMYIQ